VGVTTQRRAWITRVAVVVVATAAGVFGVAAPAFAASVSVDPTNINLEAGQASEITVTVSDVPPAPPGQVLVTVSLPGEVGNNATVQGIDGCSHPCIKNKQGNNNLTFRFRIRARPDVPAGIEAGGVGSITAGHPGESPFANTSFSLAVQGPDQQAPQQVPEVSGQVTDTGTGKGVAAAKVFLQDSAQHNFEGGTDKDGKFKFTSKPDAVIAPGNLSLIVEKEGYAKTERVEQAQAGVPLRLGKIAIASTASATASPGAPSLSGTDTVEPTLDGIAGDNTAGNEEEAGLSWLLIAIGGVLVLLGIGAIVLLLVRRRDDGDDDDDAPGPRRGPPPGRAGPPRPPGPPRRGAPPERTTVMRGGPGPMGPPVSPGPRGADQTMIARSPLADMPTQMHRPLPADPDPYATRQNGAHAAPHYPGQGYGPPPGPPAGYGAPPPAGYPGGGPSYGHPDPQYGQPYPGGGPAYPGGGGGYEQPTYGQPYGQPPTSPYDPPAGYDPYDPRGQQRPPQQPPPGNDGRRVDWLDD
jgi:hypothetical protein